jgi:hypothetical protein
VRRVARLKLEQHPKLLEEGPAAVLWAILDKIVDDYAPVVEGLESDIEEVEHTVFSGAHALQLGPMKPAAQTQLPFGCAAPWPLHVVASPNPRAACSRSPKACASLP